MDVVQLVKDGQGRFEWSEVKSEHNRNTLYIKVFRDAMKFDNVPAMTWDLKPIAGVDMKYDGVRIPASAHQLQEIADLTYSMLMTPKVIDMIWLQAGIKFDSVVNVNGKIVAITNITDLHSKIESQYTDDGTSLISCVGKYWCLTNELTTAPPQHGDIAACNYGWFAKSASGPCLSPGTSCWQRPGFRHGKSHYDPSQTIRLMYRIARLIRADGSEELVDLYDIANDNVLAPLLHFQGKLKYLRQKGVDELQPLDKYKPKSEEPTPGIDPPIFIKPEPTPEPKPESEPESKIEPKGENKNIWNQIWQAITSLIKSLLRR
jgi:hypothetical protein